MPERDKSVNRIAAKIVGARAFDGLTGSVLDPHIRRANWQGVQALVDEVWVEEVKKIDWNRALLTAESRHRELRRQEEEGGGEPHGPVAPFTENRPIFGMEFGDEGDVLCPDCVVQSLIMLSTISDWERVPERDEEEDRLWRKEWLEDSGGALGTVQAVLPHILKAAGDKDGVKT